MKNIKTSSINNKLLFRITIIFVLLGIFVLCTLIFLNFNKDSKKEKDLVVEEKKEPTLNEIKEYLNENFDKYTIGSSEHLVQLQKNLNDLFNSNNKIDTDDSIKNYTSKFIQGDIDIILGPKFSDDALSEISNANIDLGFLDISKDALVFIVNKNLQLSNLTTDEIKNVFNGNITNWNQVNKLDNEISIYQAENNTSAQINMIDFMNNNLLEKNFVHSIVDTSPLYYETANFNSVRDEKQNKFAIGYDMYTSFDNDSYIYKDTKILSIDGIIPNDDSIFNDKYPIVTYNSIYYDKNNDDVSKFVEMLYAYLISDEGSKLINDSGNINLVTNLDRNILINNYIDDINYVYFEKKDEEYLYFYNEEKNEFYHLDDQYKLITFNNFADFILYNSKYKNNKAVRDFLTKLYNVGFITENININEFSERLSISTIIIDFNPPSGPSNYFNFKYNNKYYARLEYSIIDDEYLLIPFNVEIEFFEQFENEKYRIDESLPYNNIATEEIIITKEELKDVFFSKTGDGKNYVQIK